MRISDWSSDVCSSDLEGPIRVGDETFDGHMPSFASALDDAEIARLVTYLRERFAGRRQGISDERVSALRREFADAGPFAGGQAIAGRLASSLSTQPHVTPFAGGQGITHPTWDSEVGRASWRERGSKEGDSRM